MSFPATDQRDSAPLFGSRLDTELGLPLAWPEVLLPAALSDVDLPTPFLISDIDTIRDRYARMTRALPGVAVHYALKCNPSGPVVEALAEIGSSFEVASAGELRRLQASGIDPADVLYSNPVKPASHIAAAHEAGLWRFACDSEAELRKLAREAPGSAVYLRLRVDDSDSIFPLSRKFGVGTEEGRALLLRARALGLRPYGLTFHVGSQSTSRAAWRRAIGSAGLLMSDLLEDGIELEMLNISGGFPARYVDDVPDIDELGRTIMAALDDLLPYAPARLIAEPGRYLVAESGVLVATVIGRERRGNEDWVYTDVSAYHGLMETQQTAGAWQFPLACSSDPDGDAECAPFTVTGPTCDSDDTMFYGVALPRQIDVDDRIYIGSAGAYTLSYATHFNGFPPPTPHFVGRR